MDFQSFLTEKLKEKGLSLQKLSDISGIALKHLENLNAGNLSELPPSPYLRGYFKKIGDILEFDGEKAWREFKFLNETSTSGPEDSLPKNRFAKRSSSRKKLIIGGIILVTLILLGIRIPKILGRPQIDIIYPNQDLTIVTSEQILVRGKIKGGDKLLINNEDVIIGDDGIWQKSIFLSPDLNTIEFKAKKFLGQETNLIRKVLYEAPLEITPTSTNSEDEE